MPRGPLPRLRRIALALPKASEKASHGEPTFWVGTRMFASFADAANHHGAGRHAVWCNAAHVTQDLLVRHDPRRYFVPAYVGRSGWIGVYLDGDSDWGVVSDRLAHAHALATQRPPSPRSRRA